ncbi:hypothetical protein [Arenimonas aestuarii]
MRTAHAIALILALLVPGSALAYQVPIDAGDRSVYLRVGDGEFENYPVWLNNGAFRPYIAGGSPESGGAVSQVRVALSPLDVGNGVPQPMTGNGRTSSDYDGFQFCDAGQIYVGGFFRRPGNSNNFAAQLSVLSPPTLNSPQGNTIPVSEISWTTSGIGDTGAQPVPPGQLAAGSNPLTTFQQNTWNESCLSFSYANSQVVAAGTYTTTVTFTLVTL